MPSLAHKRLLVTHGRPHIDDLAAMWLFKRFYPPLATAAVDFLERPQDGKFAIPDHAIAIGIGLGEFDEHKGDIGECAATLVWKWLAVQSDVVIDPITRGALERIVEWVRKEDQAELKTESLWQWTVTIPAEQYWNITDDKQQVYHLAAMMLDGLFYYYQGLVLLDHDWEQRIEFSTPWGPAVAIETAAFGVSERAYQSGAVLIVQIDPSSGSRQFRSAGMQTGVDLSNIYEKVHDQEPKANWFLNHSKTLLLCGSRTTPKFTPSKLTLEELIKLVKK